jgi:hypothetical protein
VHVCGATSGFVFNSSTDVVVLLFHLHGSMRKISQGTSRLKAPARAVAKNWTDGLIFGIVIFGAHSQKPNGSPNVSFCHQPCNRPASTPCFHPKVGDRISINIMIYVNLQTFCKAPMSRHGHLWFVFVLNVSDRITRSLTKLTVCTEAKYSLLPCQMIAGSSISSSHLFKSILVTLRPPLAT